jgi:hypothetical protein
VTKEKFVETIIEKVVLAALIAAFSMVLLYGYNLFNKSFDSAREQSRAFSTFAIAQKDAILSASKQVRTALRSLDYRSSESQLKKTSSKSSGQTKAAVEGLASPLSIQLEMIRQLVEMDSATSSLAGSVPVKVIDSATSKTDTAKSKIGTANPQVASGSFDSEARPKEAQVDAFLKTAEIAREINQSLGNLVAKFQGVEGGSLPPINGLKEELAKINGLEARFVRTFNLELGTVLSTEFSQFFSSYYAGVPWYGHPALLVFFAIGALLVSCIAFVLLPNESSPPAKQAATSSRILVRFLR